jgi:phenylpropionate dioxygenase-like ring-hydroxylating dioxygenase large terminal subunit
VHLPIDELVQDDRVHRNLYTSPDIFAAEMERIYRSVWVYVAHASEIPDAGDFKTTYVGLSPVIVARSRDGSVSVLLNRCAHRGLTVCQQQSGNAAAFRCAYHTWTYDLKGALIGTPYPKGYDEGFDRNDFGLGTAPRVAEYRGFIFASFNPGVGSLTEWLGPATEYIDGMVDASPVGKLRARSGTYRYEYRGNWKLQLEGSVDGYHPYLLHKSFFDMQDRHTGKHSDIYSREDTSAACVDLGNGHSALDSRAEFLKRDIFVERVRMGPGGADAIAELEAVHGAGGARDILRKMSNTGFNLAIFPNLILIQTQIRVIRPIAHDVTRVEITPTTLEGVPQRLNQMRLREHEIFFGPSGFGSPDDLEAFTRTQTGIAAEGMEWMDFSRGKGRERPAGDRVLGHVTDETHQRGIYREWRRLMKREASHVLSAAL